MSSTYTLEATRSDVGTLDGAYWILRVSTAAIFIGHGAFGFITKAAWLPYFAVVGVPASWAWRLMPIIGSFDVLAAMAVLFAPRGLPLVYMTVWAAWTALLRPLAGESIWEAVERAGNYGVPLAFMMLTQMPRSLRDLFRLRSTPHVGAQSITRVIQILRWTSAALLFGHGALAAVVGKPIYAAHFAAIGFPERIVTPIGMIEMVLAFAILLRPSITLLLMVGAWKVATESLWAVSGAPVWEVVERGGSYGAPLALALLLAWQSRHEAENQ